MVSPQVNVPASQSAVPALVILETPSHPQEPEFELQPLNNVRRTTARRLTEAKQTIPHFYLSTDCKVDQLLAFREDLGRDAEGRFRLSVNDLILKAVAIVLCKVPGQRLMDGCWNQAVPRRGSCGRGRHQAGLAHACAA